MAWCKAVLQKKCVSLFIFSTAENYRHIKEHCTCLQYIPESKQHLNKKRNQMVNNYGFDCHLNPNCFDLNKHTIENKSVVLNKIDSVLYIVILLSYHPLQS